jgi:hypothetical protein
VKHVGFLDHGLPLRLKVLAGISLLAIGGVIPVLRSAGSPGPRPVDAMAGAEGAAERARANPWSIRPARLELIEATAPDLEWLDHRIQLPTGIKPSSAYLLHLLRVHGKSGRVDGGEPSSGEAILRLLTEEGAGAAYFGQAPLIRTASGVRFPTMEKPPIDDRSLETHRDQTLAAFGELGLPLSYPLKVGDRPASLRDVLRDSIANFHRRQEEIAWTAMAYVLYLPPIGAWVNRYGERFTFDDLADELQRRPMDKASCGGIHLLYALTLLARVDREAPVLSEAARARLVAHLARCVAVVERTQQPDGSWPAWWNHELLPGGHPSGGSILDDDENRLLITGHLAEWLLYVPADVVRFRSALTRAGGWLRGRLRAASRQDEEGAFCPYSHAVCVLKQVAFLPKEVAPHRPSTEGTLGRTR